MNDLKDALTRVADTSAPGPLSLEHVRGRAKQIRRRRTTASVIGSAAAVAAIAGLGVAFLPSDAARDSVPPATQTPARTTDATDPNALGPVFSVRLDVSAGQTFDDGPPVPYWHDGQIVDTDGTATPLRDRPFTFAKDGATGGWDVIRAGGAHAELVKISAAGDPITDPLPTFERGLATGPNGDVAAIVQRSGGDWYLTSGEDSETPLGRSLEAAAIDGFERSGDVVITINGRTEIVSVTTGTLTELPGVGQAATAASIGLLALGADDGTWTTHETTTGGYPVAGDTTTRWTLDWAGVNSFSPDGRYVALVGDPRHRIDGSTDWDSDHATGTIWIRTAADLLPVAAFRAPHNGYFGSWTWDGDELLANVFDRDSGEWSLLRLSADGVTVGRAMSAKGDGEQPAYVFAVE